MRPELRIPKATQSLARRSLDLLATKFITPSVRPEHLLRARQLARIDPQARLLLVSAPAGYGKTTLVGQWVRSDREQSTAWVQLGPDDRGEFEFWGAIVTALAGVDDRVGRRSLGALSASVDDLKAAVLGPLIDDLCQVSQPLGLVLDDFHYIDDPVCHTTLDWFIERAPANLRIAIATRHDPVLSLGRLRAQGQLTELSANDLRFDAEETEVFLNRQLGLGLVAHEVEALHRRTEGWPAGLYLAALSLRRVADRAEFVAAFAGDDQHIVDYLGPELLGGLDDSLRVFLLRTSILERFCAPLCDAVLLAGDSDEMLVELERSNMFLVALDSRRRWYRYHHLFRDLLALELERTEPALVPELHRRAAAWHEQQGNSAEAVNHTLAAGDLVAAAGQIATNYMGLYEVEGWSRVAGWLRQLPEAEVADVPGFMLAKAMLAGMIGDHDEVERLEALARRHDDGSSPPDGAASTDSVLAIIDALHPFGDTQRARAAALRAAKLETGAAHALGVHYVLGMTGFWAGVAEPEVRVELERAVTVGGCEIQHGRVAWSLAHLAYLDLLGEDLEAARRHVTQAVDITEHNHQYERPLACSVRNARGWLLLAEGRPREAEVELLRSLELARAAREPLHIAGALRLIALCRAALGDATGAEVFLEEAREIVEGCAHPGFLRVLVEQAAAQVERAVERARSSPVPGIEELSDRELQVLRMLSGTLPLSGIASELFVSHNTVKTHCKAIYRKLDATGRADAIALARELGLR